MIICQCHVLTYTDAQSISAALSKNNTRICAKTILAHQGKKVQCAVCCPLIQKLFSPPAPPFQPCTNSFSPS